MLPSHYIRCRQACNHGERSRCFAEHRADQYFLALLRPCELTECINELQYQQHAELRQMFIFSRLDRATDRKLWLLSSRLHSSSVGVPELRLAMRFSLWHMHSESSKSTHATLYSR